MESQTLMQGSELNADSFKILVNRLRAQQVFTSGSQPFSAKAIFNVQRRVIQSGLDKWNTSNLAIFNNEGRCWTSPGAFYNDPANERFRVILNKNAIEEEGCTFLAMSHEDDQLHLIDKLDGHFLSGWEERWENLNVHFTREAAEAFIEANSNDYPDGLRVHVTEQSECWEFNAIRTALIQGKLVFKELEGVKL